MDLKELEQYWKNYQKVPKSFFKFLRKMCTVGLRKRERIHTAVKLTFSCCHRQGDISRSRSARHFSR